jgi:DNA-binding transcriptional LysR family regulator
MDEPDLEFERLLCEELVLAAPSGRSATKGDRAVDLRALSKENFIVPPRDVAPGLYDLTISHCHRRSRRPACAEC